EAALADANRAHQRRYLQIGEVTNGLVRLEGQLVPEAAAMLRTRMESFMKPVKGDQRTAGQRAHDALVEVCRRAGGTGRRGGAGGAGSALCLSRLRPAATLVRRASPGVLGGRRADQAGEPGPGLRVASPKAARGGLETPARERRTMDRRSAAAQGYAASANRLSQPPLRGGTPASPGCRSDPDLVAISGIEVEPVDHLPEGRYRF